ncbi:MAG: patatin-like phospholipase family protein [Acidobacteria bacterium]|nr:patatin-like phospholipase family protein [Acidobacteriota bacterium]MCL5287340.1 patatin-like phospholipase family protein [Acidobacteriota bacterium]
MAALIKALLEPLWDRLLRGTPRKEDAVPRPSGIGLALGGGFARGFAHLGVLRVLEAEGVPIACIAGTSVGSILGAAYASGVPLDRIIAVCREVRLKDFSRWSISRMGLASNERMGELIRKWFRALRFEQMRTPLAVVATDLGTGEPYVFRTGEVVDAVRASCAFPGLFQPVMYEGRCLADGGLVAPVPTQAASAMGASFVVGVNVGFNNWNGSVPKNVFQVVARSINAAQKHHERDWERFADLLIEPDVHSVEWDSFHRAEEIIRAGEAAARRAMPRLRDMLRGERRHSLNTTSRNRWTETPASP